MAKLSRHSYATSIIVATLVIGAQNLAVQYSATLRSLLPPSWVGLVVTAGIAGIVYKLAMQLYEMGAWKLLNRNLIIAGRWKHKLNPTDEQPGNEREGEFTVLQNAFEIKVVAGRNFDSATGKTSHWRSIAVFDDSIEDRSLWLIFEINRAKPDLVQGEAETDRGLIHVHLEVEPKSKRINRMTGQYWDAGRSNHRGTFDAERIAEK